MSCIYLTCGICVRELFYGSLRYVGWHDSEGLRFSLITTAVFLMPCIFLLWTVQVCKRPIDTKNSRGHVLNQINHPMKFEDCGSNVVQVTGKKLVSDSVSLFANFWPNRWGVFYWSWLNSLPSLKSIRQKCSLGANWHFFFVQGHFHFDLWPNDLNIKCDRS